MSDSIHYVFRPIQKGEISEFRFLPGDCLEAGFFDNEVIPFHLAPHFHSDRGHRADYYEGIRYDNKGRPFLWEEVK